MLSVASTLHQSMTPALFRGNFCGDASPGSVMQCRRAVQLMGPRCCRPCAKRCITCCGCWAHPRFRRKWPAVVATCLFLILGFGESPAQELAGARDAREPTGTVLLSLLLGLGRATFFSFPHCRGAWCACAGPGTGMCGVLARGSSPCLVPCCPFTLGLIVTAIAVEVTPSFEFEESFIFALLGCILILPGGVNRSPGFVLEEDMIDCTGMIPLPINL